MSKNEIGTVQSPTNAGPTTTTSSIADQLEVLRKSLAMPHVPYTSGVHPVKAEDLVVYYDVEGEKYASRIDLGTAEEGDLEALASACQQATFGVNQADVLDESYRKAGKMDLTKFAARFDVVASGLIDNIGPDILQGQDADGNKKLRAEMYKLNVYGPGSFFKAHKDTPRGDNMIGSLVVVFPTSHTGGQLTLEHGGLNWTFDSAAELADPPRTPALAYAAFYSDVTHAVEPVLTGHRVTLTYNLFLVDESIRPAAGHRTIPAPERALEETLRTLLGDPAFLPAGGFLAYGLEHQYPMPPPPEVSWVNRKRQVPPSRLGPVLQMLKGCDARIRTVSQRLGLATHVKILYDSGENYDYDDEPGHDVLADDVLDTADVNESYGMSLKDEIERMGVILQRDSARAKELRDKKKYCGQDEDEDDNGENDGGKISPSAIPVHWVTKINTLNRVQSQYIAYGNDAAIQHVYGNAALFVHVPAVGVDIRAAVEGR
ncbi:hypothetical protein DFH07DRAFT_905141 [Mycena maculata]|uniref:Fe2OG dioxygenase domain-containing protein n=1 Tax=Mycena maculata TaxID=230809 RepID=A0AAD7IHJ1_9AGAR|nr:hypothetical protein DFH07DRAFT_905141 [Mycena maculata]